MPQVNTQFTPEQKKAFEEKHNLGVYSHEAIIEVLMQYAMELAVSKKVTDQQESRIQQIEERLMETIERQDENAEIANYNQKHHDGQIGFLTEKVFGENTKIEYISAKEFLAGNWK